MEYVHTMVRVKNLEASMKFYCDLLGLHEVHRQDSEKGRFTLVFLAAPDQLEEAKAQAAANAAKEVANAKKYDMSTDLGDKTPVGAQKSGNAAGTIPAWTGGITSPPAGFKQGDHHQLVLQNQIVFALKFRLYKVH